MVQPHTKTNKQNPIDCLSIYYKCTESPKSGDQEGLKRKFGFLEPSFPIGPRCPPDLAVPGRRAGLLTVVPTVLGQRGRVVEVGGVPAQLAGLGVVHGDGVL